MQMNATQKILIFSLILLFGFYDMLIQIFPGIITDTVMRDLQLSAKDIGILSGIYFYTYLFMQIPAGLLFDRFRIRYVVVIPLIITVIGALLFSYMHSFWIGCLARLLMGFGTAFAFVSISRVSVDLFHERSFPILVGIAYVAASFGALFAEVPLALLIKAFGWRASLAGIGIAGLIFTAFVWVFINYEHPSKEKYKHLYEENILMGLKYIISRRDMWFIAIVSLCSWAPIVIFASLWGVPYVMEAYKLSKPAAASLVSMVWLGLAIGSPLLGFISNLVQRRCSPIATMNIIGAATLLYVLYDVNISLMTASCLLLLFGISCAAQPLTFSLSKEMSSPSHAATSIAFNNMASIMAGALFQPITGFIIDLSQHSVAANKEPIYTLVNYRYGLIIIPLLLLISAFVSFRFIKETRCEQQVYD